MVIPWSGRTFLKAFWGGCHPPAPSGRGIFYGGVFLSGRGGITNVKGSALHATRGVTEVTPPGPALFFFTAFRKGLAPFTLPAGLRGYGNLTPPSPEFLHCVQDDKWGMEAKESRVLWNGVEVT